jgi:hypothetical protein
MEMRFFNIGLIRIIILLLTLFIIIFNSLPSVIGEDEFRFLNIYWEPEKPNAGDDLVIYIEIVSPANISEINGEFEYDTKGVSGYGPATITASTPMVQLDESEGLWRYKTGTVIDEEDISPLKLTINAIDEKGEEITKEVFIPFEGGYEPSSNKDSNESPSFDVLFTLIAILVVIIYFNDKKYIRNK